MYLIVGLGNPGKEYENTRHNIGFRVVGEVAGMIGAGELKFDKKFNSLIGEGKIEEERIVLVEPQTYMNLSGDSIRVLLDWYKIKADRLIVCYDDVDVALGEIKLKFGGGAAGHHGLESVIDKIKSPGFIRVRIGIGRPAQSGDVTDYVLGDIPPSDQPSLEEAITNAAEAVLLVVAEGIEAAKIKYHQLRSS